MGARNSRLGESCLLDWQVEGVRPRKRWPSWSQRRPLGLTEGHVGYDATSWAGKSDAELAGEACVLTR